MVARNRELKKEIREAGSEKKDGRKEQNNLKSELGELDDKTVDNVVKKDKKTTGNGDLLNQAINHSLAFIPSDISENLIKNFSLAKKIYGKSLIKLLSNYNPDYVSKNINLPEFKREIKKNVEENIQKLKDDGLVKDSSITKKGFQLASITMLFEELDKLKLYGGGKNENKKVSVYGDKDSIEGYKRDTRYRDIALKKSIKLALRRHHKTLIVEDIKSYKRKAKGKIEIVYALDASGSMKGKKIEMCKKAGIALAFKAIENMDQVGLLVFNSEVKSIIKPTNNFSRLLMEIVKVRAIRETNIKDTIESAITIFPDDRAAKHLMLITDAMPTKGSEPEKETLEAVEKAREHGITISLLGINLDEKGRKFAEKVVQLGDGRMYIVKEVEEIDSIVLEDYYLTK